MLYQLEQGATEQKIINDSIRYKWDLPDTIKNAPELYFGLNLYLVAFCHLSTCRAKSPGTIGNITYFMAVDYCTINDIIGEQRDDFIKIMLMMDEAYRKHMQEKT